MEADIDTLPEYRYEQLQSEDSVRVLVLYPAEDFDAPLRSSIIQHSRSVELRSLQSYRHYSAVSYTWGNQQPCQVLYCHDDSAQGETNSQTSIIRITPNVEALLRHLRKSHKVLNLWIDAICLNQRDGVEKGQQIQLMGEIYKTAKRVHVWLGEDEGEAQRTFALIRRLNLTYDPSKVELNLLEQLLKKRWFGRRWIIQEVALSHHTKFHWGRASLDTSWLVCLLPKLQQICSSCTSQVLLASLDVSVRPLDMLWMLEEFDQSECGDPKDRVAALMGMAPFWQRIQINSNTDDWKEVYARMATHLINRHPDYGRMIMYQLVKFGPVSPLSSSQAELFSWVPNWGSRRIKLHASLYPDIHTSKPNIRPIISGESLSSPIDADSSQFVRSPEEWKNKTKDAEKETYAQFSVIGNSTLAFRPTLDISGYYEWLVTDVFTLNPPKSTWRDILTPLRNVHKGKPIASAAFSSLTMFYIDEIRDDAGLPRIPAEVFASAFSSALSDFPVKNLYEEYANILNEVFSPVLQKFSLMCVKRPYFEDAQHHLADLFSSSLTFTFGPRYAQKGDLIIHLTPGSEAPRPYYHYERKWARIGARSVPYSMVTALCVRPIDSSVLFSKSEAQRQWEATVPAIIRATINTENERATLRVVFSVYEGCKLGSREHVFGVIPQYLTQNKEVPIKVRVVGPASFVTCSRVFDLNGNHGVCELAMKLGLRPLVYHII
ncbi:hypothetical protein N0V90_011835 [Kalmusia sp. IMI 367209]|nr:hypothetical protein N0V90_011835 [Kalmusia sp. IMI 367209]